MVQAHSTQHTTHMKIEWQIIWYTMMANTNTDQESVCLTQTIQYIYNAQQQKQTCAQCANVRRRKLADCSTTPAAKSIRFLLFVQLLNSKLKMKWSANKSFESNANDMRSGESMWHIQCGRLKCSTRQEFTVHILNGTSSPRLISCPPHSTRTFSFDSESSSLASKIPGVAFANVVQNSCQQHPQNSIIKQIIGTILVNYARTLRCRGLQSYQIKEHCREMKE